MNALQPSDGSGQQSGTERVLLSSKQYGTQQVDSGKVADTVSSKISPDSKHENAGFSTDRFNIQFASTGSSAGNLQSDSVSLGNSKSNSLGESAAAAAGSCMNMSVDEPRSSVSATEKPRTDSKTAEAKLVHRAESSKKQASADELMEGSFRDESRINRRGDVFPPTTKSYPSSTADVVATVDSVKTISVFSKPSVSAGLIGKNCAEDARPAKSTVCIDSKLNAQRKAPISFSDVAKTAPMSGSSRNTSQVNDSFAYRDQSVVLISDDDSDDGDENCSDKRNDNTGSCRGVNSDAETAASKQRMILEAQSNHTTAKSVSGSQLRSNNSEVSTNKACQPSTVVTVRLPANASVQKVDGLSSGVDMEKLVAKRDSISTLLNRQKVLCHCYFIIYLNSNFLMHVFAELFFLNVFFTH